MKNSDYFKHKAKESSTLIREIREWLHQHPELSFNEVETASYITHKLSNWNIPFRQNIGGHGIIAWIEGSLPGKNIALRAEIDALPIEEANNVLYASKNKGIMHACGHDVHTAFLLGAIKILSEIKHELQGTIYGIFQPAEEKIPGGAYLMLQDEFFKNLKFDAVIAQHVLPDLPSGHIGIKPGPYMASTDEIYITIKGKGGHAATPHQINDTVLAASQLVVNLQALVSRFTNPTIPTVLSFGKFIANGATNIIPNEVKLEGTFRTFDEEWRQKALSQIIHTTHHIAKSMNVEADIKILNGYPSLINNNDLFEKIKAIVETFLPNEKIEILEMRTTAEDFAYFAQKYPSLMYRIGTGGLEYCSHPLHSPNFNVNEEIFSFAHGLLAYIAYKLLF
jgi:amidohydrolase